MLRLERRMRRNTEQSGDHFDPEQSRLELALRGRAARKVRTHLRRRESVVVHTPRWSSPQGFFERVSMDLAVGEGAVRCRVVDLRPAQGRALPEAWRLSVEVLSQLGRPDWGREAPFVVADRGGFRAKLKQILMEAERSKGEPIALLLHGAEHLPVSVVEDLAETYNQVAERLGVDRRGTLLLAGGAGLDEVRLFGDAELDLADYGEEEAERALVEAAGPLPRRSLAALARFTGGVPQLVESLGAFIRTRGAPALSPDSLLAGLGPLGFELRGAVDIANADDALADRLMALHESELLPETPDLDGALWSAGLVRRVRQGDCDWVGLRAPAIGALVA